MSDAFDAVIVGAGAAGLHAAALAGQRGLSVLLLDHAPKVAEKIRVSGGGRCNFTNHVVGPEHFVSQNPDFCRSALARYTPRDFLALMDRHGIGWHEKHRGQLFCNDGSSRVIQMLLDECAAGHVHRWQPCRVAHIESASAGYRLATDRGTVQARSLVIATGGLSVPAIGASDFGHRVAHQFGHRIVTPRPGLVPLTFNAAHWKPFLPLAGVALEVGIATGTGRQRKRFQEDLLFTHRGLSGPAVLQISSFWVENCPIEVDLGNGVDLGRALLQAKGDSRRQIGNVLAQWLPQRLAEVWLARAGVDPSRPIDQCRDSDLRAVAASLGHWSMVPSGTEGWRKAEVTVGGVDTRDLDSRTMESHRCDGLYFIGEVVDVTGWLGGYNFQWAWSSAASCAAALPKR